MAPTIGWGDSRLFGSGRCHDAECNEPVAEKTPAAVTGRCFLAIAGPQVKEVPEFVATPAKAIRRGGVTEPAHRTKVELAVGEPSAKGREPRRAHYNSREMRQR